MSHRNMDRKAFTLIELIVVITILVILGTIGFMNYTSYTLGARDTKRKGDLTLLDSTFRKLVTQGIAPGTFLSDTGSTGTGAGMFSLNGIDLYASGGTAYAAGIVNLDNLQEVSKDTVDPKTLKGYRIGAYGSDYELAATLEESNTAYVLANYKKRTASGTVSSLTGSVDTVNFAINLTNYSDSMKFAQGDVISTGGTMTYTVGTIQGTKIYLSESPAALSGSVDKIRLARDETDIIGNAANGSGTGTDCANPSNIAKNRCPVSDSVPGLVPYKVD